LAQLKAAVLDLRLARQTSDLTDREMATILRRERWSLDEAMSGLRQRIGELKVVSPKSGHLTSVVEYAAPGRWVHPSEPLAVVLGDGTRLRGLVAAADVSRIRPGMSAMFIPNDLFQPSRPAIVREIAIAPSTRLEQLELAGSYGGKIPTRLTSDRGVAPLDSQYAVIAHFADDGPGAATRKMQPQVGVLHVTGDAQGLLQRVWNRILLVLVRESGF
jgi:putative peptide zinc metalloprotease protein